MSMSFDEIWERAQPKTMITRCSGITVGESDLREVFIYIKYFGRVWLKADGTYSVSIPGQSI